ncbi:MAG: hypothetical protein VZS44_11245 [Bacilli bacterium]|nr:hypothetical protein [Bacilli bacterium]
MNKEIEELLNKFKNADSQQFNELVEDFNNVYKLLSYIEQLEADYKEANDSITWWTNRYNALNKEYKLLKDRNEINIDRNIEAYRIVKQLENNRDKAIEYIENGSNFKSIYFKKEQENLWKILLEDNIKNDLLSILKGDSDYE